MIELVRREREWFILNLNCTVIRDEDCVTIKYEGEKLNDRYIPYWTHEIREFFLTYNIIDEERYEYIKSFRFEWEMSTEMENFILWIDSTAMCGITYDDLMKWELHKRCDWDSSFYFNKWDLYLWNENMPRINKSFLFSFWKNPMWTYSFDTSAINDFHKMIMRPFKLWKTYEIKNWICVSWVDWMTTTEVKAEVKRKRKTKTKAEILEENKQLKNELDEKTIELKNEVTTTKDLNEKLNKLQKEKQEALEEINRLNEIKYNKIEVKNRSKNWDWIIIDENIYNKLKFAHSKTIPVLLRWPSWTGKSTIIRALADDSGVWIVEYNFNGDTTVENLLGHKILVGWNMMWEDGPLTDAMRHGKVFIAQEINASHPATLSALNWVLEVKNWVHGSLSIQGNNWEVVHAHPNFRFYWTYNPNYLGTYNFNTSILSRFVWIDILPLSVLDETRLLAWMFPSIWVWVIEKLSKMREELQADVDFTYDISTRDLVQVLSFIEWWFDVWDAVMTCVWSALSSSFEQDGMKKIFNNIFK